MRGGLPDTQLVLTFSMQGNAGNFIVTQGKYIDTKTRQNKLDLQMIVIFTIFTGILL